MKHQVTASIKLQGQASHQVMEAYGAGETNPSWSCFVPQKGTLQTLQEYKMTNFQPDKRKKREQHLLNLHTRMPIQQLQELY
jgi:hypothetical protein